MSRLSLGTFEATDEMVEQVVGVLKSGRLSYGEMSRTFEDHFALRHACAHGVLSNSGTSSLVAAIQAMKLLYGWQDGDEIIVPALTFVASVNAVLHNRLTPVLVDVHPAYFDLDWREVEKALTPRTRALMAVNLFGHPCHLAALRSLANEYALKLIEDSCEAVGATFVRRPVGSWGDVGCFSFYMAHILTTGVGGMATTNDEELALKMRSLVNHGIEVDSLPNGEVYDPTWLARHFRFTEPGHSFRMTEIEAAIGLVQLARLDEILRKRRHNATLWEMALSDLADLLRPLVPRFEANPSWMMYPIVRRDHQDAAPLMAHLRQHGIECRSLLPLTTQPYLQERINPDDYPVATRLSRTGLYVGCHEQVTEDQIEYAVTVMKDYFERTRSDVADHSPVRA